jgi:hypothetical protein
MGWIIYQGIGVPSNPVFHNVPSISERKKVLIELNVPLIRWIEQWDDSSTFPFYGVIQDHHTEICDLKRQVRYEVKRALRNYYFQELLSPDVINEGFKIYIASFKTYDTYLRPLSENDFKNSFQNNLLTEKDIPKFFGIRESSSNTLVCYAYGVHYSEGNYFDLKVVKFDPEHLKNNISELLFYEIGKLLLLTNKLSFIFDGFVSIAHKSNIQEYLVRKFNYRKAYCKLCVHYQPYAKLLVITIFPFRRYIRFIGRYISIFSRLSILLSQEELRKKCN